MMIAYPKILSVTPIEGYQLQVTFRNHETKVYDCGGLLNHPAFAVLRDPAIFRTAQVDAGGYGVRWNDDLDLSESELWLHGVSVAIQNEPVNAERANSLKIGENTQQLLA